MILKTLRGKSGPAKVTIQKIGDGYFVSVTAHASYPPRSLTQYEKRTYETIEEAEKAAEELTKIV